MLSAYRRSAIRLSDWARPSIRQTSSRFVKISIQSFAPDSIARGDGCGHLLAGGRRKADIRGVPRFAAARGTR